LVSDFTPERGTLIDDLKDYNGKRRNGPYRDLGPDERRLAGTAFYDALYFATTEKLATAERGKRALILFSDGEDNSSAHHMLDAIEAAQSADVVVYGIRYTEIDKRGIN